MQLKDKKQKLLSFNHRSAILVVASLVITFVILRVYLHLFPGTNLDIAGYNIHHLFTGLLLMTVAGVPLIFFSGNTKLLDFASIVFGSGLSMALDEWVYLIVTDGSDASYLLPVSLWGAVIVVGAVVLYSIILIWLYYRNK